MVSLRRRVGKPKDACPVTGTRDSVYRFSGFQQDGFLHGLPRWCERVGRPWQRQVGSSAFRRVWESSGAAGSTPRKRGISKAIGTVDPPEGGTPNTGKRQGKPHSPRYRSGASKLMRGTGLASPGPPSTAGSLQSGKRPRTRASGHEASAGERPRPWNPPPHTGRTLPLLIARISLDRNVPILV
jgi:hypothetical protein